MARLLIVEDDINVRDLYREEFEAEGYEVELVADGAAALERLRSAPPDVVILDIGLPEKSGLEVLDELGAAAANVPVIVNTAYPLFRLDFRAHRARAWLTKSSDMQKLKQVVSRILEDEAGAGG